MTKKCSEVQEVIALEGRAPQSEDHLEHVSECAVCARFLKSVVGVEDELGALATLDVDDTVVGKLLVRPELGSKDRSSHKLRWAMGLAAAAMIAFVAARVTLMGRADLRFSEEISTSAPSATGRGGGVVVDDVTSEEGRPVGDVGDVGDAPENRANKQARSEPRPTGELALETQLSDQDARDQLESGLEGFQRGYAGSLEEGKEYESNELLKKDEGESEVGFGAGSRSALSGIMVETPMSEAEPSFEDSPKREAAARAQASTPLTSPQAAAVPPADDGRGAFANAQYLGQDERADAQQLKSSDEALAAQAPASNADGRLSEEVALDKNQTATENFRSRLVTPGVVGGAYDRSPDPEKRVHIDAVYPEPAKPQRLSGTVALRAIIDRGGNVIQVVIIESVPAFDQAAIDAVQQWKYEASEQEQRSVTVRIAFEPPVDPEDDARSFFEERERIDNLRFRDARGYWANTYLPGDPKARFLAMRLRGANQHVAPHLAARPIAQPFDAPTRGALSVSLQADRRGVTGPQRLLLQVGVQATENYGRRRPPMNVGIVLDADPTDLSAARALIESLQQAKALGDRFRLIVPGKGEVVSPDTFQHGALTVALDELEASSHLESAVRLAVERVHAGDDPTMPLGSSLVLVITPRKLGGELAALSRLAHQSAVGGVPVSVVGVGSRVDRDELERLALSGQGRRYFLEQAVDATGIVDRELAASSRVVARALRLRIKLAADVRLVDVIGSESLSERQSQRVREAEKSIDLRLSRNLGIEADRGEDEDGIQIVIPSFYAGDAHTILLDVVVARPGAIAEVTARYKDLSELRNTVAKASLSLSRSESAPGPLETNVLKNYLSYRLSEELESAADELDRNARDAAVLRLTDARDLLIGLGFGNDTELNRDIGMLGEYIHVLSTSSEPALVAYLADSLRYAGANKKRLHTALT